MWIIFKFDKKKIQLLKEDFKKKLGDNCTFYSPKLLIQKYKKNKLINNEVKILGDYMFCFHKNFANQTVLNHLKFSVGLKYILDGFLNAQNDIEFFIKKCKKIENRNGYITETLYEINVNKEYKFTKGPFVEKIFKIIDLQKNKINILMGDLKTTVNRADILFKPI